MDILNSREWAILIWALIAIAYISHPKTRGGLKSSLKALLRALFSRHIVSVVTLMTMYVVVMVYGFAQIGLWDDNQLKSSVIWYVTVAIFSLLRINHFTEAPHQIRSLVTDGFKLIVIVEYLVGTFTFHFLVEFALVPVLAVLSGAVAYAEVHPEFEKAHRILSALLSAVALLILGAATYLMVTNFHQIANRQAVIDFVVPVILSASYIPFLAFMVVYSTYRNVLIRLRYSVKKRPLEIYARLLAMLIFNVRIGLLKRWVTNVAKGNLETMGDVHSSIRQIFGMVTRENDPPKVARSEGWSPYEAKDYLLSVGIDTGHYHPVDPADASEWFCCSSLVDIGKGLIPSNIAYYLNGDEQAVKSLKLKLNVNEPEYSEEAHAKLLAAADSLARQALGVDLRDMLGKAIIPGKEGTFDGSNFKITFTKHTWPNHAFGGYDLGVELSVI